MVSYYLVCYPINIVVGKIHEKYEKEERNMSIPNNEFTRIYTINLFILISPAIKLYLLIFYRILIII